MASDDRRPMWIPKDEPKHIGGRLAANFRRANIAEGFGVQMFRPFCAIAEVEREEDHGVDLIGTLLRRDGLSLIAEDSFLVQIKTYTAAKFTFKGDGIKWLRQLKIPYFPVIVDLNTATVSLYSLSKWHWVIHTTLVDRFVFLQPEEMDEPDDFSLGKPLMQWSMADAADPAFPIWAYSVLKPAVQIESQNQFYGPMWRFVEIDSRTCVFADRNTDGTALYPPRVGEVKEIPPADGRLARDILLKTLGSFINSVSNTPGLEPHSQDILHLRQAFRNLGLDPDPANNWDSIANEMADWLTQQANQTADMPPS